MSLTAAEKAKREDFDRAYRQGRHPSVRAVERCVCGCTYGATSWATRAEADLIAAALDLAPGTELLEIGAGSGWPAVYLATRSGCAVTLTDLPATGLEIALERAALDGLAPRCRALVADAAHLPFAEAAFDVINQSDVLCCLVQKERVLRECRRVIRPGGRMACSLIYVPPGLALGDHARAVETAPEFVESDCEYPVLFAKTGWSILERRDFTTSFTEGCRERMRAEAELRAELEPVIGADELDGHHARLGRRLDVLERGHLRRELFLLGALS